MGPSVKAMPAGPVARCLCEYFSMTAMAGYTPLYTWQWVLLLLRTVWKGPVDTLDVRRVYGNLLIEEAPGSSGLFATQMALATLRAHELSSTRNREAPGGAFVSLKLWHLWDFLSS